jgi:Uma2 family endonuclease
MDPSKEELFTHGRIKVRITATLESLVTASALGYVFSDRTRFHSLPNELSVEPDVLFFSFESVREGRVRLSEGAEAGYISIEGSPEVVVEIVSLSSVTKDTAQLRDAYFEAGVLEYWLIDARREPVSFELLKLGSRGYTTTRAQAGGWLKSAVFGKSFRITQATDPLGNPQFTLEHRD